MIFNHRRVVLLAATLLVFCLGGCAKDPAQLYEDAKSMHAKGEHSAAIIALKSAIQQQPENAEYRFLLGRVYNEVFDGFSAEKELRKATELGSIEGGRVAVELSKALLRQRNFAALAEDTPIPEAYESGQRALLHALRGHALLTVGKVPAARAQLKIASGLSQDLPESVLLDARLRASEGKVDEALELVDATLKRDPKHFDAWTMRAGLMRLRRDYKEELAAYDKVLAINPFYIDGLVGRSTVLLVLKRVPEAQKDVATLNKVYKGNPIATFQQGLVLLVTNRYPEALEAAMATLKRVPDYGPALVLAGMSHLALNAPQQAERVLAKFVADNPGNEQGRRLLAQAQVSIKQGNRAIDTLKPMLQRELQDGALLALASEAYQQVGDNRKAKELIAKAAAENPENSGFAFKQAMLQINSGEADSAIADLTRSANAATGATRNDVLLILALTAKGDLAAASQAVQKLEQKAPGHVLTHTMKGHVLILKGDAKAARVAFEAALKARPDYYPAAAQLAALDEQQGDIDSARRRFEAVLSADKKSVNALMGLARLEIKAAKPDRALELLTQATTSAPQVLDPKLMQIRLLVQMGDLARARSLAETTAQYHADSPQALEMLAAVQLLAKEEQSAVSTAARRASLERGSADAQLKLAAAQFGAKEFRAAEASARQALKLDARYAPARSFLVSLLLSQNRAAEALSLAREAQKQQANRPEGFVLEGDVHAGQKAWSAASSAYRQAITHGAGSDVDVKLFRARMAAGEHAAALQDLSKLVAKRPDDAVIRIELADALMNQGQPKEAAEHYAHLVKRMPASAPLLNNLAWAYFQSGDSRALATAEQAHRLNKSDPRIADTLGWILVETDDRKRGLSLIEKAAADAPDNGDIRFHYAFALAKSGDKQKAREELRQLLASGKEFELRKEASALAERLN